MSQKTSDWGYTARSKGQSRKNRAAATVSWGRNSKNHWERKGRVFKPEQWKRHGGVRRAILAEAAYLK